jgi:cell division protein FtsZ
LGVAALAAATDSGFLTSENQPAQHLEIEEVSAPSFEFRNEAEEASEVKQKVSTPGYFGDDLDLPEFFR